MKKTEIPGIYKVSEGVLINKDNEALRAYKVRKHKESRIDKLEQDISEIKLLLKELLSK